MITRQSIPTVFQYLCLLALVVAATTAGAQTTAPTLKKVTAFDLPGPGGKRFDYLAVLPDEHYLLSAHMGADRTYVIDMRTNTVVATVSDTPGVEGIEYVPELKKFYTSNSGDNTIGVVDMTLMTVFNLDTHKAIAELPLPAGPDVIKFDAGLGRIYVACSSGAIAVFQMDDADHYRKLEDFPVEKRVHTLAVDQATHRVYAPEQDEAGKPVARMVVYEAVTTRK
jgi:YVTN family beta-propeller protein